MDAVGDRGCAAHRLQDEYNPFEPPQLDDPFPVWTSARREAPVFYSASLDAWVVTRYQDVVRVLRDSDQFGPGIQRKMFAAPCPEADAILESLPPMSMVNAIAAEPPVHTKMRRYLQPTFMPRRIAPMEEVLRHIAGDLADGFGDAGSGDFYGLFAFQYPLRVVFQLIGLPVEHREQVKEWANQQQELRYGNPSSETQVQAAEAGRKAYEFALRLVAERRENPQDDLLSWIIADSDGSDDPMSEAQLASQVGTLITAGHETTSHFLTMMFGSVLPQRDLWAGLASDPELRTAVVEESLRLNGPVQSLWRKSKVDTDVGGVPIPAGARLSVVLGSANTDDAVFDEAEEFQVGRANVTRHVAFGRGIHTCVGAPLARLEGRVALEVLADRLPRLRLAGDPGYLFKPSATQRMAQRLLVDWN